MNAPVLSIAERERLLVTLLDRARYVASRREWETTPDKARLEGLRRLLTEALERVDAELAANR